MSLSKLWMQRETAKRHRIIKGKPVIRRASGTEGKITFKFNGVAIAMAPLEFSSLTPMRPLPDGTITFKLTTTKRRK